MTYQSLYDSATRMICETASVTDNADYLDRASYLFGSVCNQNAALDRIFRAANDRERQPSVIPLSPALTGTFPLSDEFAPAVIYYVSSLLVLDENESMSEKFFDLYADAICSIRATLPLKPGHTANAYPGMI